MCRRMTRLELEAHVVTLHARAELAAAKVPEDRRPLGYDQVRNIGGALREPHRLSNATLESFACILSVEGDKLLERAT